MSCQGFHLAFSPCSRSTGPMRVDPPSGRLTWFPPQAELSPSLLAQLDAVGDPLADHPDDALGVAEQGGERSIRAGDFPAAKEVAQWRALAAHAQGLKPVARPRRPDEKWRNDPVQVDRLIAKGVFVQHDVKGAGTPGGRPGHLENHDLRRSRPARLPRTGGDSFQEESLGR